MNNSSNHFSDAALRFLRGLRKNNDRTWFNEHKPLYTAQVYEPMLSLCDAISEAMREFAPYHVKPGRKAIMRIYENLRFHQDKLPYKNHLGAWWGRIGTEKTSGAGYYFHISSTEVLLGAGCFMPSPEQLVAIRAAIDRNPELFRKVLASKRLRTLMPTFVGDPMPGVPRGYSETNTAVDLLRCRKWGVEATLPPETALQPTLLSEIVMRFRVASPLVNFLNGPLDALRKNPRAFFKSDTVNSPSRPVAAKKKRD